jgi:hypothetical protein
MDRDTSIGIVQIRMYQLKDRIDHLDRIRDVLERQEEYIGDTRQKFERLMAKTGAQMSKACDIIYERMNEFQKNYNHQIKESDQIYTKSREYVKG